MMRVALEFVRNHWVLLLCGVVSVAALVFGVMGMTSDTVREQMQREVLQRTRASSISSLKRNPKNEDIIAKEKKRVELFEAEKKRALEIVRTLNFREPLLPDVFPKPARDVLRFRFREAYRDAMAQLPVELQAGTLPTPAEIEEERLNVADMLALEQPELAAQTPTGRTGRTAVAPTPPPPPGAYNPYAAPSYVYGTTPGVGAPGGRQQDPKYDPVLRARVVKAHQIRCYVDEDSFHISPIVDSPEAPKLLDMWLAQVGLWIQQDLVHAMAGLNDEAARRVGPDNAYVEYMPVKRVDQIRIAGYVCEDGLKPFPYTASVAGGTRSAAVTGAQAQEAAPSFTGRTCNELYDVVRLSVTVVADQREILRLIDRISRQNLFTCVGLHYSAVDRAREEQGEGYLYGPAPVIRVTMDFEFYMLRSVYQPLMPEPVKQLLGISKP